MSAPSNGNEKPAAESIPPPAYPDTPDMAHLNWPKIGLMGRLRFAGRVVSMVLSLLVCVPLYYVWRLLRLSNPWPKYFLASVAWICGARIRTVGTPLKRDVFYVSNHLSWVDIPIIGGRNGSAFVAQDGIAAWPLIGWLCTLNDTVFVSRSDRMGIANQINQLRDALAETWAITIFPEGTTTDGRSLLPFKSPLLQVLDPPPPGVYVQPIFLDFHENGPLLAWIGEETAPNNAWRLLTRRGGFRVTLNFLEPFHPRDFPGRKAIAAEARRRIEVALSASLPAPPAV